MTNRHPDPAREELERQLQPTPHCIPIEQFADALTEAERDHLAACTRCQAELALWQAFTDLEPVPEENAAVRWIAAELRRRAGPRPGRAAAVTANWLTRLRTPTFVAVAASALLAVAVGYIGWDPEPRIDGPQSSPHSYRTTRMAVVAPLGDLKTAPEELIWVAVDGAVRYDVRVLEIDGTSLWDASTAGSHLSVPAAVAAQFVPGKTIHWEVTARDTAGAPVAVSGTQRFRLRIDPSSRRR